MKYRGGRCINGVIIKGAVSLILNQDMIQVEGRSTEITDSLGVSRIFGGECLDVDHVSKNDCSGQFSDFVRKRGKLIYKKLHYL